MNCLFKMSEQIIVDSDSEFQKQKIVIIHVHVYHQSKGYFFLLCNVIFFIIDKIYYNLPNTNTFSYRKTQIFKWISMFASFKHSQNWNVDFIFIIWKIMTTNWLWLSFKLRQFSSASLYFFYVNLKLVQ